MSNPAAEAPPPTANTAAHGPRRIATALDRHRAQAFARNDHAQGLAARLNSMRERARARHAAAQERRDVRNSAMQADLRHSRWEQRYKRLMRTYAERARQRNFEKKHGHIDETDRILRERDEHATARVNENPRHPAAVRDAVFQYLLNYRKTPWIGPPVVKYVANVMHNGTVSEAHHIDEMADVNMRNTRVTVPGPATYRAYYNLDFPQVWLTTYMEQLPDVPRFTHGDMVLFEFVVKMTTDNFIPLGERMQVIKDMKKFRDAEDFDYSTEINLESASSRDKRHRYTAQGRDHAGDKSRAQLQLSESLRNAMDLDDGDNTRRLWRSYRSRDSDAHISAEELAEENQKYESEAMSIEEAIAVLWDREKNKIAEHAHDYSREYEEALDELFDEYMELAAQDFEDDLAGIEMVGDAEDTEMLTDDFIGDEFAAHMAAAVSEFEKIPKYFRKTNLKFWDSADDELKQASKELRTKMEAQRQDPEYVAEQLRKREQRTRLRALMDEQRAADRTERETEKDAYKQYVRELEEDPSLGVRVEGHTYTGLADDTDSDTEGTATQTPPQRAYVFSDTDSDAET